MEGRIKFVDAKTQKWGYIVPSDKSADVYFKIEDFIGPGPSTADSDAPVQFELVEQGSNREARRAARSTHRSCPKARKREQ